MADDQAILWQEAAEDLRRAFAAARENIQQFTLALMASDSTPSESETPCRPAPGPPSKDRSGSTF